MAVGLGGGGCAKGKPSQHDGKWLVLDAETLQMVATPPHKRKERISCINSRPTAGWWWWAQPTTFAIVKRR